MRTLIFQRLAQCGYFGLLILIPVWHLYLSPPMLEISPWLVTSIWFLPLLFPLKGILKANPYTYAWSAFISLIYIMHACVILMANDHEFWLAAVELGLSSVFLAGTIYFAKYRGIELGLSIRKKKEDKAETH